MYSSSRLLPINGKYSWWQLTTYQESPLSISCLALWLITWPQTWWACQIWASSNICDSTHASSLAQITLIIAKWKWFLPGPISLQGQEALAIAQLVEIKMLRHDCCLRMICMMPWARLENECAGHLELEGPLRWLLPVYNSNEIVSVSHSTACCSNFFIWNIFIQEFTIRGVQHRAKQNMEISNENGFNDEATKMPASSLELGWYAWKIIFCRWYRNKSAFDVTVNMGNKGLPETTGISSYYL